MVILMESELASTAKETLKDCSRYALFDASGTVLAANFQVRVSRLSSKPGLTAFLSLRSMRMQPTPAELQALVNVLDERDSAIRNGLTIDGQRYEVSVLSSHPQ